MPAASATVIAAPFARLGSLVRAFLITTIIFGCPFYYANVSRFAKLLFVKFLLS